MKIYLDTCTICRPFDNIAQLRVRFEAQAAAEIVKLAEENHIILIASAVLVLETNRNPREEMRRYALNVLSVAKKFVSTDEAIIKRARQYEQQGIKPLDALHLASAEAAQADYFCTCDDRFLKKARRIDSLTCKIVTPIELIQELET